MPLVLPKHTYFHEGFTATWMLASVLVTYASFDKGYVFDVPGLRRALEYVGGRSYAVYLLHVPVLRLDNAVQAYWPVFETWSAAHPGLHWLLYFALVLAFAEVSWRSLEAPMQKLGRRLVEGRGWPTLSRRSYALGAVALLSFLAFWNYHALLEHFRAPNLALRKPVTQSSILADQFPPSNLTNGVLEYTAGAHTRADSDPWLAVDLGSQHRISEILIYNRWDGWQTDSLPITVELSSDNVAYHTVGVRRRVFSQFIPWKLELPNETARYVRVHGASQRTLCLSELEVFGT
jgi:hypothetical protein